MKAVIVENRKFDSAALTDDGCIIKVRNQNYAIGQVIELKKPTIRKPAKVIALAASAAAVVIMFGVTAWAYFTPYTYVSFDVNPSIEYSVNRFNRVLSVTAVNGDGADIIKNLDLTNKTIDEAVKDTVEQVNKAGYFETQDPGGIMISTSSDNQQDAEKLASALQITAEQATENAGSTVEVQAISVVRERVLEAQKLGTTPGKLNLVQKLQASMGNPDSVNVQEWLKKPVKEIMKAIKTAKKESKSTGSQDGRSVDSMVSGSSSSAGTSSAVQPEASAAETESQTVSKPTASNNKNQIQANEKFGTASKVTGRPATAANENNASKITEKTNTAGNANTEPRESGNATSKITGKPDTVEKGNSGTKKTEKSGNNNRS